MLTETDIERIARRIAAAYQPVAVGIVGSYATGRATARSDLDVLVVRNPRGAVWVDVSAVRRLLFDVIHPLDVLVYSPAEFEESAGKHLSFTWTIARQARLYHCAADAGRLVPSLVAQS
jgi:predicted nucleotidyltransferase